MGAWVPNEHSQSWAVNIRDLVTDRFNKHSFHSNQMGETMKYLLLACLLIGCGSSQPTPQTPNFFGGPTFLDRTVLTQDDNFTYRIPSLLSYDDKLILFASKLKGNESDTNDTTIIVKQLEPKEEILSEIDLGPRILGSPQPIYDNGVINLFFSPRPSGTAAGSICETPHLTRIWHVSSLDGGRTWSIPTDLSEILYPLSGARNLNVSPTTGIAKDGVLYLIAYINAGEEDCRNRLHLNDISIVFSYDGSKWRIFDKAPLGSNENVYDLDHDTFWARNYVADSTRLLQLGDDSFYFRLAMPHVHSGMIIHNDDMYFSYPASNVRSGMVFKKFGRPPIVLHRGPAAYSNIAFYKGSFAIIYEAGAESPYEGIRIQFIEGDVYE